MYSDCHHFCCSAMSSAEYLSIEAVPDIDIHRWHYHRAAMSCELCRQLVTLYHCTSASRTNVVHGSPCPWHQTLGSSAPCLVHFSHTVHGPHGDLLPSEQGPRWWTCNQQHHNSYCWRCRWWCTWCTSSDCFKRYIWLLVPGSLGYDYKATILVFYTPGPDKNILVLRQRRIHQSGWNIFYVYEDNLQEPCQHNTAPLNNNY